MDCVVVGGRCIFPEARRRWFCPLVGFSGIALGDAVDELPNISLQSELTSYNAMLGLFNNVNISSGDFQGGEMFWKYR